ncbi:MAG TPA: hypothetical protein VNL74_08910 [Methylococcus sp.]|nr:hypothetical protein [Methylococcus sp.]
MDPPLPLEYPVLWRTLAWVLVLVTVVLSLLPQPPTLPDILGWDKALHTLAYLILMWWFRSVYGGHWRWPLFLLGLGVGLELLQGLSGIRTPDLHDIIADGLGILIGAALARTPLGRVPVWLDQALARLARSAGA